MFRVGTGGAGRLAVWLILLTLVVSCAAARSVSAQAIEGGAIEAQAIPARPFGVAAVSFPVSAVPQGEPSDFFLEEANARVFYPVFTAGRLARLLGDSGDPAAGASRTVCFLFQGAEPLQLTLHTPAPLSVQVRPEQLPPRQFDRLLTRWWREYHSAASEVARRSDYPPVLETYLTGMLGQRLNLRPPLLARLRQETKSPLAETLDLVLSTEALHVETIRQTMSGPRVPAAADQPVPLDVSWAPLNLPAAEGVLVEPIARHVPEECFYVRFGSFDNYLWLDQLTTSYGGDIGRMVTARGQDARLADRVRRQLSLPDTALARIFGGQLIADVALVGRDVYLQDGAAVGVLFHARNSPGLAASLQQQRSAAQLAEQALGATLETESIAGRDVSFLSTPDNQLRSYYVAEGDFHFVTTSRRLAERFVEAGRGQGSLGDSAEFQLARARRPLDRKDTIFAYLSTSFFSGLGGAHYQIELQRRMQAAADLELVQLARLAATGEGASSDTIEALVAGGFLPAGFGRGVDGSGPIVEERRVIDSLRGARGTFTPIPDVPLPAATRAEVAAYGERARYLAEKWRRLDPLLVAVQRTAVPGEPIERVTIDANISPLAADKYGWILSLLGPPVSQRVAPRAGDVITMQAYLTGGEVSNTIPPHLLFLGIQDMLPTLDGNTNGLWQILRLLRSTPGYLGAWPKPGFMDWLPLRLNPNTPDGYSRILFDVWRWQGSGFSLLSFHRDVLDATVSQLRIEDADQPAQIRVTVGDLAQSQLRDWVNWLYYQRSWETSAANVKLLQAMTQQLRVPPEQAVEEVEQVLNTRLLCSLGGKYELVPAVQGRSVWRSSSANGVAEGVPAEYVAPLLQWFRGLDLSLTKEGDQVVMHADLDMKQNVGQPGSKLPLFDLFRGRRN